MKNIRLGIVFAFLMSAYALLRDFRDAFFISILGITYLPYAKIGSLLFLCVELFFYQKLLLRKGPKKTLLLILFFYILLSFISGILLFFYQSLYWPFAYLFYISVEGFPPFIWSAMWVIVINLQKKKNIILDRLVLLYSLWAQGGACCCVFVCSKIGMLFRLKQTIFFALILLIIAICLIIIATLFFFNTLESSIDQEVISDKLIHNKNIIMIWKDGIKKISISRYLQGIIFIMLAWEFVNVISNYIRLSIFSIKNSGTIFLSDLYGSMVYTYLVGFLIVLYFLIINNQRSLKKIKLIYILWLFPLLIFSMGIILYFDITKSYFVIFYMILRALYPSLIFPLKEAFFSVTDNQTKFIIKSFIDSFISRFGKLIASLYFTLTIMISDKINSSRLFFMHGVIWVFIIIVLFYFLYKVEKKYIQIIEDNRDKNSQN